MTINGSFYPYGYYPSPDIFQPDGDLHILFLEGNGVRFRESTSDDWYRGNIKSDTSNYFTPEEAASPVACMEQYQFCRGDERTCGPFGGLVDAVLGAAPLFGAILDPSVLFNPSPGKIFRVSGDSPESNKPAKLFMAFAGTIRLSSSLLSMIGVLGARVLASQSTLVLGVQGPLPVNQWQLDVTQWWATWLSSLQIGFVNFAKEPDDRNLAKYRVAPEEFRDAICDNQV